MPVVKTVLKNAEVESIVKVAGTSASATISLANDLLGPNQVVDGATQSVAINGIQWTGGDPGLITIVRNSVTIMTLQTTAAGALEMNGQMMIPDTVNSTSDVVVTISGAQCECWIRLKKLSGYKSKIEYSQFGSYDDPTKTGE